MERMIRKICTLKGIEMSTVDDATTNQLVIERQYPALALKDGSQIPFEDIICHLSHELYLTNKELSRLQPMNMTLNFPYNNAGHDQKRPFFIQATYEDLIELTVALIRTFASSFEVSFIHAIKETYMSELLDSLFQIGTPSDIIFHCLSNLWTDLNILTPRRHAEIALPLERHYGPSELLQLCFTIAMSNLTNQIESFVMIMSNLSQLKEKFQVNRAIMQESFVTDLIDMIGSILITRFLHTDELYIHHIPLVSRTTEVSLSDDELMAQFARCPTLKEKLDLQVHAETRHKSRALFLTAYLEVAMANLPPLPSEIHLPDASQIYPQLTQHLGIIDTGEDEIAIAPALIRIKEFMHEYKFDMVYKLFTYLNTHHLFQVDNNNVTDAEKSILTNLNLEFTS